jgi:hypothetical protein
MSQERFFRRPKPRDGVEMVEVDGEGVVCDPTSGPLSLNTTGTILWYALDGRRTVEEIATDLSQAFGADEAELRTQVRAFVDELDSNGLLA